MKKVAGSHSFERGDLATGADGRDCRKNLGIIDCHKDGWATRGNDAADDAWPRRLSNPALRHDGHRLPGLRKP